MNAFEEPTNEFRQVRHNRRLPRSGDCVSEYVLQRKWIVHEGVDSACGAQWSKGRDEWRPVPIVDANDIK